MEGMTWEGDGGNDEGWVQGELVERKYHSHHCMLNTLHPAAWQSTAAQSHIRMLASPHPVCQS